MILATQWSFSSNKTIINLWFEYCDKVIVHDIFVTMLQLRYYYCYLFTTRMHLEVGANCLPNPPCHCSCFSKDIMMGNVLNSRVQVNWFVNSLQHLLLLLYHTFFDSPTWNLACVLSRTPLILRWHNPRPCTPWVASCTAHTFLNLVHLLYIIHPLNVDQTTHINLFNNVYHKACHHIKERRGHLHLQHA